nr:uncharacterized protein C4orf54 homolog [Nothobranchius furzeri]
MEAAEKTLTYRDDTGLNRKLLKHDTFEMKDHATAESNYVDLDMKPDGPKTVKVTFTGDGNQLSVIKSDGSSKHEEKKKEASSDEDKHHAVLIESESLLETVTKLPNDTDPDSETEKRADLDSSECGENACSDGDELRYTDMCRDSKTESDDGTSAELSDHCGSDTVEDDSHYITTHEIQLTELDHDVDYDLGRGTRWEFEDGNLVYSFVDYASFESDESQEGTVVVEGRSQVKVQSNLGGATVSTEQEESDLCDSDKCASSDESMCRNQSGDNPARKIHLSIQTSSRALNEPVSVFDNSTWHTKPHGDRSHFSFVSSGARAAPLCDRGQYFIPAPGRQHLATKLRRKDINEYSSGASSSISELDDADKEVRNLTAKSFRSLACPYFDAINLSTSSESSVSEYGLNKWSAYVDWNYGKERSVIAHKTSSATLEMSKNVDNRGHNKSITSMNDSQTRFYSLNKRLNSQLAAPSSKKIQMKDHVQPAQRGVTLNVHCNGPRGPKCPQKARPNQVSGTASARSGCEMECLHTNSSGDTHKRAIFASSLLKNVISKKMQFEQERKMERGEIHDSYPPVSPSSLINNSDGTKEKSPSQSLHRQSSESGSACTADDQHAEGGRPGSCGSAEEIKDPGTHKATHIQSQKGAEPQSVKEAEPASLNDSQTASKEGADTSSMLTKLLFVPSCQLLSKDKKLAEDLTRHTLDSGAPACSQKCDKDTIQIKGGEKAGKTPEIKICLRKVKENQGCTLNIANLLTPKISYNVRKFRAADESKCQVLSATEKVPNFTVRDVRETKCKFQTPIYQVRDVRKLVKSSYRFVSLDNGDNKCSTAAYTLENKAKAEPVKHVSPSPMVIKCNSVKTNVKSQMTEAARAEGDGPPTSESENTSSACATGRIRPDQPESQPNPESKLGKQRQDERRNDAVVPKRDAMEKIKAAVKTMEELYVFDRNEWKRKNRAADPVADSHVLSLLAREERGSDEQTLISAAETERTQGDKRALNIIHVPYNRDTFKTQSPPSKTVTNKSVLHVGNRSGVSINSDDHQQSSALQKPTATQSSKTAVKIEPPAFELTSNTISCSDSENYLTMPGLGLSNENKLPNEEHASSKPEQKRSPLIVEDPAATIYHHPTVATSPLTQHKVLCFSPSVPTVSPAPPAGDTVPQTQRKMLLDPTTGHCYLVDTPIAATTKRLFDPETGQYMDVPLHSPVAPITPVPISLSPLALRPGAYTPTYMIYPAFIPSPPLMAKAVMPQSPHHHEDASARNKTENTGSPQLKGGTAEKVYYSAVGEAPQLHLPVHLGHVSARGGGSSSDREGLISITKQQGPRIVVPPSFDGKTMSFVVEHR